MTPEEEVKMLNEDHEIWKKTKGFNKDVKVFRGFANILDLPDIHFNEQLNMMIEEFRTLNGPNPFKESVFSFTRPLFAHFVERIPLCTTDEDLAKRWLFQINATLLNSRVKASNELRAHNPDKLDTMYSVRCVLLPIDPIEGDEDEEIRGMYYFGLIVSHYMSERKDIKAHAETCEILYNTLERMKMEP